jgi:hypothetical protein
MEYGLWPRLSTNRRQDFTHSSADIVAAKIQFSFLKADRSQNDREKPRRFGGLTGMDTFFSGQPIAALPNELSANEKVVFSVRSNAEVGVKG